MFFCVDFENACGIMGTYMDPSYNNSFGNGMPVSYGTGDIILAPDDDSSGKPRKGLVIALVVLVVLLVGAGVGFAAWRGMRGGEGSGESGGNVALSEVEEKFNIYANYMISGEAKTDPVEGEYDEDSEYAFEKAINTLDTGFLGEAEGYWKEFLEFYDDQEEELLYGVILQNDVMSFFTQLYGGANLSDEELMRVSVESNGQSSRDVLQEKISSLSAFDSGFASNYLAVLMENGIARLEYYDACVRAGCIRDYTLDDLCVVSDASLSDLRARVVQSAENENIEIVKIAKTTAMWNIWNILEEMKDEE